MLRAAGSFSNITAIAPGQIVLPRLCSCVGDRVTPTEAVPLARGGGGVVLRLACARCAPAARSVGAEGCCRRIYTPTFALRGGAPCWLDRARPMELTTLCGSHLEL